MIVPPTNCWALLACCLASLVNAGSAVAVEPRCVERDVIVYGGTSAGVAAAVQAARMGRSVALVCNGSRLGGMSSGGLGFTDAGSVTVIGGIAREFYHHIWRHYQQDEAWNWQRRNEFENRGQGIAAIDDDTQTMWVFEPRVASEVFEKMVAEHGIDVFRDEWLDREPGRGVSKTGVVIESFSTLGGSIYSGRVFIDATYEGDLMAAARVSYHVGRESKKAYGEVHSGVQRGVNHHPHNFQVLSRPVDPYVTPGDPRSGLLPRISDQPPGENGDGDHRLQAYCYRLCLTDLPANRLAIEQPHRYDAGEFELLLRVLETGWRGVFTKFDPIPNRKTDVNNHGPFSMDNIGYNYEYPEASYKRRAEIIAEHRDYQQGLLYFLANDPRVPSDVREEAVRWGLSRDEFRESEGWPEQIYVREARRMIGEYVMTEHEVTGVRSTPEPVGMGSYTLDSHNVQRYVDEMGYVQNEGDVGVRVPPYGIAFRSLLPKNRECTNLLVPVCLSASHIAYGSIRMEPVFMVLGQSAATAASMAIDQNTALQSLSYQALEERLLADGQILRRERGVESTATTARHSRERADLAK